MSWGAPLLLLTLLLPLAGAYALLRHTRVAPARWPSMLRVAIRANRLRPAPPVRTRPAFILLLAIALALLAVARPRWGEQQQNLYTQTREVMIAIDLSRSMLAEDVAPSRLEQARSITRALLDNLNGERVGLIVFAGTAFVQVPLSSDYQIVHEFLPLLDPDYMPQGGSDYTGMLKAALDGFGEDPDVDRYLIVLSDGESTTEGWAEQLPALDARKIHVLAMGLGTPEGGFIRDDSGGYVQDANGDVVHSRLQPATLQTLARRTNGRYLDASTLEDVRPLLAETVETGRKGSFGERLGDTRKERYQWLLLPAVLLTFVALLREFHQRPRPRDIRRAPAPVAARPPRASMALLLALGCGTALLPAPQAQAHFDADAEFEVREVFDSNPIKRLRAIVRHLAELGYDAYDLRLMVEETIKYGLDEQRTGLVPSEGVIRDAVQATLLGEQLDPGIADWSFYRARLTDMLVALEAAEAEAAAERPDNVDEEDTPPTVSGQGTQQAANDSFGHGASAKTDAALGDLSADADAVVSRGKKPPPPPKVKTATSSASPSSGGGGGMDAILQLTKKNMEDVTRRDSPGRLHQLLADNVDQQEGVASDW